MSEEQKGDAAAGQGQAQGQQQAAAPVFRLQKMYLKDLSFESPTAPGIFTEQGVDPKADVQLKLENRKLESADQYEVTIKITATVTNNKTGKTMFIVEVEHGAVFLLQNIPAEHMPAVLAVECPATLFPFTRQIISQTTADGGFMPFLMDPVNFLALYENSRRQQQQQQEGVAPQQQ
ncbi:protein-export chaperone SecB [Desulfurivibrio alkaliphilus]|uniref:Protein-export protein SecB n=1 Tax=Desulfurivibrio alkaliphilus (strain DSM 19089 / UNIQEM U267 / AHT2) TaxID=589865 RepID=D6Z6Y4_DESAT|nr:protein-export chaperone SecB [Desulfurivibrio alkaliphilus]ADH86971.1 protein-export protein SecB [Desulfurivibrio alkaliphilus AHT 2]